MVHLSVSRVVHFSVDKSNYLSSQPATLIAGVEIMSGPRFSYTRLSNRDLLEAIKSYTAKHGYSPTIRELAQMTGAGLATVHRHLDQLIHGGYIEVEQPRRRLLRVVKDLD